ncbi:LysR family transcriptional regulator [Mediterraneibacter glycyrrhizinilyticus]|uniref:LysR family transcriptional regulator n=1 Tax=Mediterraneibacter glycyrrhizinilyticus TaxID=342942 RepID=UPI001961BC2F|nr:LysR family transcriptional regulator [Mediterraneibacter glycyrrhizinilyticus]MBM6750448.1 LysR family transcriptional regulator [Mediterraneibacter glycyrrhizinilyticus]
MNTVQLECFIAVAEYLNFSKASRSLKITQPAVSHQIQTLEEELEVKLFNRTSKSVTLTHEGALFLTDAQLILKTALSAKERLGSHENFISLELGCHNYMELNLFPPVLKKLSQEFPLVRPNIRLVPFPSLLSMIENNQVQAALGVKNDQKPSPLLFRELCSAPVACVCSPDHPLAQYKSLTKRELTGNFIACSPRQISDSLFTIQNNILVNLLPGQRFFAENVESAFALAKALLGYTLYPDIPPARDTGLCYIPVTDLPRISFGIYYQYGLDQPVLKRFLTLISGYMKEAQA